MESEQHKVILFTNGQTDDYVFAQSVVEEMSTSTMRKLPVLMERALEPEALISQIAQCQAIVAHRLHANIIAYSLGIPSVDLIWDQEVEEFGKITKRCNFYIDPLKLDYHRVSKYINEAIRAGIDPANMSELMASARQSVKTILDQCIRND